MPNPIVSLAINISVCSYVIFSQKGNRSLHLGGVATLDSLFDLKAVVCFKGLHNNNYLG